jgi:hypothetical protein
MMMTLCSVELLCLRDWPIECHLNCSVCATSLLNIQLNCSVWTGSLTVCQLNCSVWTSLLNICQLNFSVRATGLLNLWSAELLRLRDSSLFCSYHVTAKRVLRRLYSPSFKHLFFNSDPCQNFPLSTIFSSSVSVYISHKSRYCKHSVYYPTWFLVLLAWTKTLSSQEAIRVIKCLHAG